MKIQIDRILGFTYISHNDESIKFNMKLYNEGKSLKIRSETKDPYIVFRMFLESLSQHELDKVFDFYKDCKKALDDVLDSAELTNKLKNRIAEISKWLTIDRFKSWYAYKSGIPIPSDLKEKLSDVEDPGTATEEQTYLRGDYIGLCGLSMAMTMLAPVFSEYVYKTKDIYGTVWKTYHAYLLISKSDYYTSEENRRLNEWIGVTISSMNTIKYESVILKGISSSELIDWMHGVVIAKRVATGDITGAPGVSTLITILYKYIQQKSKGVENDFHGRVTARLIPGGSNDETAVSKLEAYNPRQLIPDNYVVISEEFLNNPLSYYHLLDETLPRELVEESLSQTNGLFEGEIEQGPLFLLKWCLARVVSPRMIDYIERKAVVNGMLLARAYLWHKGYYSLAGLVSALPYDNDEVHMVTGTDRRSRLVREMQEEIDKVYPYYLKNTGAKKPKPKKGVQISADYLEELFTKYDWYLTIPEKWLASGNLSVSTRHYTVEDSIRTSLINFAMEISDRAYLISRV